MKNSKRGNNFKLLELKNNLSSVLQSLQKEVGEKGEDMVYRIARSEGLRICRKAIDSGHITADGLGFQKCLEVYAGSGLGNLKVKQMAWDMGWAVIECYDSFEAATILKREGMSSNPVCHYTRGVLTAFMEETHRTAGQPVSNLTCIEEACAGAGEKLCRYLVGCPEDLLMRGFHELPPAVLPEEDSQPPPAEEYGIEETAAEVLKEPSHVDYKLTDLKRSVERLRHANAKQKEINRLKSHFISVVSHELRTPISVIKGYLELLGEDVVGELTSKQRELLTSTMRHLHRLNQLVNGILDMQKIEEGQLKLNIETLQLRELVERSIEHVKPLAEKRGHDISCNIPAGLPFFRGDRARMSLVFDNLLGNAIKFMTRKGEIKVIAEMEKTGIHVRVSDTGIGIPERERRKIFKRFYSVEDHGKESCAGAGLGLSIVKGILDEHHGKIWVESEEGKGSTFHMLLPAKKGNGADESA